VNRNRLVAGLDSGWQTQYLLLSRLPVRVLCGS